MSLYQKYRPKRFADLVGQAFVRETLSNALTLDRTVGAYLFHGSRGTGKTTVARIFAKALNCTGRGDSPEPCEKCANCLAVEAGEFVDIVEIDAASHTGVDNIREIIEKSKFLPTLGSRKVYIVDEVHMLSKGAFNALLKTLEEPPAHVVFVLATTEIHKIPETIVSRAQRFDFRRGTPGDIADLLARVAEKEGITADHDALDLIARAANGGFRDAFTLFEQYSIGGRLDAATVSERLSLVDARTLDALVAALESGDVATAGNFVENVRDRSLDPRRVLEQLLFHLRDRMRSASGDELARAGRLFDAVFAGYDRLKSMPDAIFGLEVALYRAMDREFWRPVESAPVDRPAYRSAPVPASRSAATPEPPRPAASAPSAESAPAGEAPASAAPVATGDLSRFDPVALVAAIRAMPKRSFVAMSLRESRIDLRDGVLAIVPPNNFHLEKLSSADSVASVREACQALYGSVPEVRVSLSGYAAPVRSAPDLASVADDIF